jgi:sugar phosphate permease
MFETGIEMACLIILFNWFPLAISGLVVGLWQSSYYFLPMISEIFKFNTTDNYLAGCLVVGALYIGFSIVCHFYFHHHPSHIGIRV